MTTGNTLKVAGLLAALTALFVLIGQFVGGFAGASVFFLMALVLNGTMYWFSDKLALRMAGAREVSPDEQPDLHAQVEHLAMLARLPKPRVYMIDNETPNAFATGRNPKNSAVAVTTGIQRLLTKDELAGVIAHELAHIRNRDTLISTVVGTIAGAITWIATMLQWSAILGGRDDEEGAGGMAGMLAMAILAPIAAVIIQMAISRSREFTADATGARILGDPLPLANALEKLQYGVARRPMTQGNPAMEHLYIVNPLAGRTMSKLFSTHPPIEERVEKLQQMALQPSRSMGWA